LAFKEKQETQQRYRRYTGKWNLWRQF